MATITTGIPNSSRIDMLTAGHDFTITTGNAFKLALISGSDAGTFGNATTNLSDITTQVDVGGGGSSDYPANGYTLANVTPVASNDVAIVDFSDADKVLTLTGASATYTCHGCMVYNTTNSNAVASVHDFSANPTVSGDGATLTISIPPANDTQAIIRLA